VFLPLILHSTPPPDIPPETVLYCYNQPQAIPDNGFLDLTLTLTDTRLIHDLNLYLNVSHTYVSDLWADLSHVGYNGLSVLDRPGIPGAGCSLDHIIAILDDEALQPVEKKCGFVRPATSAPTMPAIGGWYQSRDALSAFDGQPAAGDWEFTIADADPNDTGVIQSWCIEMTLGWSAPTPPPPPNPGSLPASALIPGLTGQAQAYPLDCESRSAVDWARAFGVSIGEIAFFNSLPTSDDPDAGFVGSVWGAWGQIPPNPYGVHAEPIAARLRTEGINAHAVQQMTWDMLRSEISAGRPVIAWVIGAAASSYPVFYTAPSNGHRSVVAPYEHTVVIVGYSETTVTYLNGASYYTHSKDQFLDSWGVLRNMAVIWQP
jgi:uncharacterized protein YvpB